jgi:PEGA domain
MTSSITSDLRRALPCRGPLAVAILLLSAPGAAQPTPGDPVAAQALFKAARALVTAGDWAAGCAKFEASLEMQASASTMLNIAKCHEHDGKVASAWDDYNRALALNLETRGADRRKGLEDLAKKGIDALTPRLPKLRIVVESPPPGLKVLRDGKELPAAALGDPLPADPGKHDIEVSAPGHRTETRSVTLEEGKTATTTVSLVATPVVKDTHAPVESGGHAPLWAWIAGAGGLALSGAAVFFLVDDLSAIHALRSPSNCQPLGGGGYYCNPAYDYSADDARKNRDLPLAVALGGAGLCALGAGIGGIVLGVSGRKQDSTVTALPWVGPGGAGAALTGTF